MRYDLGLMDMYPIEASGTNVENNPMFIVRMKETVDPISLENAVYRALKYHPLFETQVEFDKDYYLESNSRPIKITHASVEERPMLFGRDTNGYPWQICYNEKEFCFEWCHGITDGNGAISFLRQILNFYCEASVQELPRRWEMGPGLEPFFDSKEKGIDYKIQPDGFSVKHLPVSRDGYRADCHVIKADTSQLMSAAKKNGSSIAPVLAILFAKAIRKHLPENIKNRNVSANIVLDLRRSLDYETMHNCVDYTRVTYVDEYDDMKFKEVAQAYKAILDHARLRENIIKAETDRVNLFKAVHIVKTRKLRKFVVNAVGSFLKDRDCNFVLTYLGKIDYEPEVLEKVEDIQLRAWADYGQCLIACMDYNGTFTINICENYVEKGIVEDFISLCKAEGIMWTDCGVVTFEQAQFLEDDSVKQYNPGKARANVRNASPEGLPAGQTASNPAYVQAAGK